MGRIIVDGTVALALLLCVACSPNEEANQWAAEAARLLRAPEPTPSYISLAPSPGSTRSSMKEICVWLDPGALWEPGNLAEELDQQLMTSLRLTLDGSPIPIPRSNLIYSGPLYGEVDKGGRFAGSHGGFVSACAPITPSKGLHLASVQVTSMSGVVRKYVWAFRIE